MSIRIPRTTLVCVDCHYRQLALRALRLTLAQCEYPAVKFFSDAFDASLGLDPRIEFVPIPRVASAAEYSQFVLKDLLRYIETDFVQIIQWDGYVINGPAWTNEFLDYDYIGARWYFRDDDRSVGNGGFSLRSRRLLEALQDPAITCERAEDEAICLAFRDLLQDRYGIRIAPPALADRYSFEGTAPNLEAFGFHRFYNFPLFYGKAELAEIVASINDEDFCSEVSASLLRRLFLLNRTQEALQYAKRFHPTPGYYARLSPAIRAKYERFLAGVAEPSAPCPCGSGSTFDKCCGAT